MKKLPLLFLIATVMACKTDRKNDTEDSATQESVTTSKEDGEWIYLFDGSSTDGWRAYNGDSLPPEWEIQDGALTFDTEKRTEANKKGGNDIIYAEMEFDNFEISWEWKIPEGGNSGLLYHIKEGDWTIPETAPEYQMLDDLGWEKVNNAKLKDWQKTGSDYSMYAPDESTKVIKPAGEWNTSRIRFTPELTEYWLNGKKTVSFVPWSEDWKERKAKGKWKNSPKYGSFKSGYIGLQDHDSPMWFKNIKIKKL